MPAFVGMRGPCSGFHRLERLLRIHAGDDARTRIQVSLDLARCLGFIKFLLESPGFDLLLATPRHEAVLAQTLEGLPDVQGNLCHDLNTAVTPYADMSLSGEGSRRLSLGGQFNSGSSVQMSLEVLHDQPTHGDSDHGVMLRNSFNW